MTSDEPTRALFERVLEIVTRAEGDATALATALDGLDHDTRALALIRALLTADVELRASFTSFEPTLRDRELARRAALALTESADRIEATTPGRNPVRLGEMPVGRAAF